MTIGRRLGLLVALLGLAVAVVAVIGAQGVGRLDRNLQEFRSGTFRHAALTVELRGALRNTEMSSLEYALVEDGPRRRVLRASLSGTFVPGVDAALSETEAQLRGPSEPSGTHAALRRLRTNWQLYLERYGPALLAANAAGEQAAAVTIRRILNRLIADAEILADTEAAQADATIEKASASAEQTRTRLLLAALLAGLVGISIASVLARSIVRRTRMFSRFAGTVAAGSYDERVHVRGNDELTDLGGLLNRMVEHREEEQTQGLQRLEFTEAMQLTGSEREAHDLLKRHLERSIPLCAVTVFSRNNSADRLEPTTDLIADDPIVEALRDAQPSDCLAVRSGQAHQRDGTQALMTCKICGEAAASACRPLLVGGEVIGSVLARRDHGLTESESETMRGSVIQAAPLLANLRNLAVAERRAGTDALTGLPYQRASHETLQRMVAQANRARQPYGVLMLDLDHFKDINDVFGHAAGDNVLVAVGARLRSVIREQDFAGRYGGEEFIVLLPDTDLAESGVVAEKIRAAIESIEVDPVRRAITISIGVAGIPDHGTDAATVARCADRALYAAKAAGRNRVEVAAGEASPGDRDPEPEADLAHAPG